jgi:hypothetical protein
VRGPRKWISGFVIAALIAAGYWFWGRPSPPARTPASAPSPALSPAHTQPPNLPWPVSAAASAAKSDTRDHSGEIEVCGVGKVKFDRDDWTATGKLFDTLTKKPRMLWLSALQNSDDYRARATGLYLEGMLDRDEPQKDPEAARDELVQLALKTREPAVFALAIAKCSKGVEDFAPGACPQLTLDQWTRADPDNAVPWLQLAAQARIEYNSAAEAAAFAHAAQAHRYESYNWSMFEFARAAMPDGVTAAEQWFLTEQILGAEAAMPIPYITEFRYCSRETVSDATVLGQCNAMADLLVNKSKTLLELGIGKSLAARIGWPAEITDGLTQQIQASMQALNQITPSDPDDQWSCDSVARGNAYMSEFQRLGERGLAAEAIERSGETVAELSRKYTERMKKVGREAAAGAEAAARAQSQNAAQR